MTQCLNKKGHWTNSLKISRTSLHRGGNSRRRSSTVKTTNAQVAKTGCGVVQRVTCRILGGKTGRMCVLRQTIIKIITLELGYFQNRSK